jgi:hypothetical protein
LSRPDPNNPVLDEARIGLIEDLPSAIRRHFRVGEIKVSKLQPLLGEKTTSNRIGRAITALRKALKYKLLIMELLFYLVPKKGIARISRAS